DLLHHAAVDVEDEGDLDGRPLDPRGVQHGGVHRPTLLRPGTQSPGRRDRTVSHPRDGARHPGMNNVENIVYTVTDLEAAKAIHTALLGVEPHTDQPYYVGFNVGGLEIGLTPQAPGAAVGAIPHVRVTDLDAALDQVEKAGATRAGAPRQVAPG